MHNAIVGLGSNIDPLKNIEKAKILVAKEFKVLAESQFLTTKPLGKTDQANFLNGALLLETGKSVAQLKNSLKKIEISLGRKKSGKDFGPRIIDLDLLVWDQNVVNKDFYERDFVRTSVLELMPELKY